MVGLDPPLRTWQSSWTQRYSREVHFSDSQWPLPPWPGDMIKGTHAA
jgi:hypothetical protein